MGSQLLYVRPDHSISAPASADAVFILFVSATAAEGDSYTIAIKAVMYGASSCDVVLTLSGDQHTVSAEADESGFLSASFHDIELQQEKWISVEVTNADAEANGRDALTLAWPTEEGLSLSAGRTASLSPDRSTFLCGTPDRIVQSTVFSQLVLEPIMIFPTETLGEVARPYDIVHGASDDTLKRTDMANLMNEGRDRMAPYWETFKRGDITYSELLHSVQEELIQVENQATRKVNQDETDTWKRLFVERRAATPPSSRASISSGRLPSPRTGDMAMREPRIEVRAQHAVFVSSSLEFAKAMGYYLASGDLGGRVGLLFNDRLRFQPSGLVLGEPVYTISLAPREEVELRQVVETKSRAVMEDIVDRHQDISLNLTSSWTNEITEGIKSEQNIQETIKLEPKANVKLPIEKVSVGFGVDASHSVSVGDKRSRENARKNAVQRTSAAASRMRSQHKLRIEITTETGASEATTRKIQNVNFQRSVNHIFSKVHRKERVTLERYGVQLCLRFWVNDPALRARTIFLDNLAKFDPDTPGSHEQEPTATTTSKSFTFSRSATTIFNDIDRVYVLSQEIHMRSLADADEVPAGHVLGGVEIEVVEFTVRQEEHALAGTILLYEGVDTKFGNSSFLAEGGKLRWSTEPSLGSSTPKGTLEIGFSLRWEKFLIISEWRRTMESVTVKITATWLPLQDDVVAYTTARAQRRSERLQALTAERISQIRDNAIKDYPGQVLAMAVANNLDSGEDLVHSRRIFDFENAIIESAPYWSSSSGLANHLSLESRLMNLPIALAVGSIITGELTSPQAIVYIPVFPDREGEALDLLPGVSVHERDRVVDDITNYRNANFIADPTTLPSHEEVLSPKPVLGTSIEQDAWGTEWEKPQERFEVLAHWSLLTPTDGVHIETVLSDTVASDEHQTRMLEKQTED